MAFLEDSDFEGVAFLEEALIEFWRGACSVLERCGILEDACSVAAFWRGLCILEKQLAVVRRGVAFLEGA